MDIKICDDRGKACVYGETGELWIKTPFLMTGYLGQKKETKASMVGEWFKTGDLIRRDMDTGLLVLTGRKSNIINRGGFKVSPIELEVIFNQHHGIRECLVVGLEDGILGEIVVLLIVRAGGDLPNDVDLKEWAQPQLSESLQPDKIILVDSLPLGETGKLDRKAAQQLAERTLSRKNV